MRGDVEIVRQHVSFGTASAFTLLGVGAIKACENLTLRC
jgi:hypothetical protein